jgi:hypothetical protein
MKTMRILLKVLATLLITVVFLVAIPVFVPLTLISLGIDRYQLIRASRKFRCVQCGDFLGPESLRLADRQVDLEMNEMRKNNPGVRFRTVRLLDAICAHCGQRYQFPKKVRKFLAMSASESVNVRVLSTYQRGGP